MSTNTVRHVFHIQLAQLETMPERQKRCISSDRAVSGEIDGKQVR